MTNWKAGDVAIIAPHGDGRLPAGSEVLLVKYVGNTWGTTASGDRVLARNAWSIEQDCCPEKVVCSEALFRPLPPPDEVTSWEDCVFQPKVLVLND